MTERTATIAAGAALLLAAVLSAACGVSAQSEPVPLSESPSPPAAIPSVVQRADPSSTDMPTASVSPPATPSTPVPSTTPRQAPLPTARPGCSPSGDHPLSDGDSTDSAAPSTAPR